LDTQQNLSHHTRSLRYKGRGLVGEEKQQVEDAPLLLIRINMQLLQRLSVNTPAPYVNSRFQNIESLKIPVRRIAQLSRL
jgi:hypothetical protein